MPHLPHVPRNADGLAGLGLAQDGIADRRQLRELGWTHDHIAAAVTGGRWATYGPRAVALHRGPLTTRQRRWIAVINAGPTATLAGLTAAQELGLTGFGSEVVHVLITANSRTPPHVDGVKIHRSRRFSIDDRHPARVPPTVRLPRAVVDSAVWTSNPRRASALVIGAAQQGLARVDHLRAELDRAGMVRHRRLLLAVLDDVGGGVNALSELDFVRLARRYRLPEPELQRKRRDGYGRVRYLDARLRRADGRVVNVEIDGAAHAFVVNAWADADRDIAFLAKGEPTIRIPSAIQRIDPAGVAQRIWDVLEARW